MLKKHDYVGIDFSMGETIWKYFPFPAFMALVENGMLYFTRAKCFADPYEFPVFDADAEILRLPKETYEAEINRFKENAFVNSWRLSDCESFGMWNAYADTATGVAIKTDVNSLFSAFNDVPDNKDILVTAGKVDYLDSIYNVTQHYGQPFNFYYVALSKTKPYENEKELRLIFNDNDKETQTDSIGFPINIQTLIKEIYVGSSAKPYVKDLIENVLRKHGIYVNMTQSIVK